MKKLILILSIFLALNTFGQDFTYKIKITNVNNIEEAKLITDPIRFKFKAFPLFNDSTDTFTFNSNVNVSYNELNDLLNIHGYTIIELKKSMRLQYIKEEEK